MEKEQVEKRERDQDRDLEERANGKVQRSERDRDSELEDEVNGKGPKEVEENSEEEEHIFENQDSGDVRKMRKMMDPCLPTRTEIEEHRMTHLPFRSWCTFCVKGRGVERGHFRTERDQDAVGEMHLDYCFPSGAGVRPRNIR